MSSFPARLLASAVVAAAILFGLDASSRAAREALLEQGAASAAALLVSWCAALALTLAMTTLVLDFVGRGLARFRARRGPIVTVIAGMAFAATLLDTARWTFAGQQAQRGWLGTYGPFVALAAAAVFGAVVAGLGQWAERGVRAGRRREASIVALLFFAIAGASIAIDRLYYVGLYDRIHRALEMVAIGLFIAASALVLGLVGGARGVQVVVWALSRLAFAVVLAVVLSPTERARIEDDLSHVAPAPRLVARSMGRLKSFESTLRGETEGSGLGHARIDDLLERYDVASATRDPRWDEPFREAPIVALAADRFRDDKSQPSIIVFYVDTLRRDVAYDPEIMPNLAAFAKGAVRFDRAYSSGSDTLTALPTILGGHFEQRREKDPEPDETAVEATAAGDARRAPAQRGAAIDRGTILELARERGVPTTLFISESAWEFLEKLMPTFAFDEVERVRDYEKAGVWGYGAERATSESVVTRALDWMHERKDKGRFFSWLFNFDVHNWREIDKRTIESAAQRFEVPEEGMVHQRYRVMARSVDAAFGRLIEGLEEMEMNDDVVVLFVSDHGEGLGREDFWLHSIYLWEPLIRVPLVLRAPGLPPGVVDDPVGLVDIAPTLARYLHPAPSMNGYQGEDLVTFLVPDRPKRRLPLLLSSTNDQRLSRVGLIDGDYKLVLRTDWGEPQLFDLKAADPDRVDFGETHPAETTRCMGDLLQSPVFVNAYDDAKAAAERESR